MKKSPLTRKSLLRAFVATALILIVLPVFAQPETNTSFRTQMNSIFANLDKSKVPHGILRDYAMEFVNLENFNGTAPLADSNYAHANSYWQVYKTLISGRIHSSATGFLRGDTLDRRWYNSLQEGKVVLSGLHFLYSRFKDNAYPGFVTITSNKLYDKYVSGVWQNPYQAERTFIISPRITTMPIPALAYCCPATFG